MRLHEQSPEGDLFEHFLFLEVDRSTESRETLARRAFGYQDFYRRGGLAVRYGSTREAYKDFPFRVLMVLPNEERRNNMAERLLQNDPPVLSMVWHLPHSRKSKPIPSGQSGCGRLTTVTSQKELSMIQAGRGTGAYRRDPAREGLVADRIRKLRLLA